MNKNKIFLVRWVFDVPAIIAFGFSILLAVKEYEEKETFISIELFKLSTNNVFIKKAKF